VDCLKCLLDDPAVLDVFELGEIDGQEARGQVGARGPIGLAGNGEDDRPLLVPLERFSIVARLLLEIGSAGGEAAEGVGHARREAFNVVES
jgi:hypothetical protein